jgi:O-antigen ligase
MFILTTNISSPQDDVIGQLTRIRGAGFLSDPNDLAQILLIALPLLFIAWRRGRTVTNFVVVLLPAALLLWTTFLTHSRGGLLALAAVALLVARKKIGTTASTAVAAIFILACLPLTSRGRGISAADGADRLEAWANGLEMFKSAPLFGIGFNGFTDLYEITAHNSFVLCLAELGLLGSTLWLALLVTTMTGLNRVLGVQKVKRASRFLGLRELFEASYISRAGALAADPSLSRATIALHYTHAFEALPAMAGGGATGSQSESEPAQAPTVPRHWIVLMRLAFVSFMTSAWFLSRSYTTAVYLVLGLATVAIAMHRDTTKSSDRGHWIFSTVTLEAVLIIVIYG